MSGPFQVTLIGGPSDLQRHTVHNIGRYFETATIERAAYFDERDWDRPVLATRHRYVLQQVGYKTFIGVHTSIA